MKKYITILLSCITASLFSACGQPADASLQTETETAAESIEGIASPKEAGTDQILWAEQYLPWEHESPEAAGENDLIYLDSGVRGSLFWYLGTEPTVDGMRVFGSQGKYVLEIYDTASGECTLKNFTPKELGLDGELGLLAGMDMVDRNNYMFRWMDYEQNADGTYHQTADRMFYTDFIGEAQTADLWDTYLEKEILQEALTELPLWQSLDCRCDGNGNSYVIDDGSGFYLFSKSGELLLEYQGSSQELIKPLRNPDGKLILLVYHSEDNAYELLLAEAEEGELRSLGHIEASSPYIMELYGMQGDNIYYRSQASADNSTGEGIISWNIRSGSQELLFDFQTSGIGADYQTMLTLQ